MTNRSEFFDEGWCATVEQDGDTVTVEFMLVDIGISGRARLVLPVRSYADALAGLVAVLYADEQLLRHAVRVHLEQHRTVPLKRRSSVAGVAGVADVASVAVQRTCARRSRG